MKISIKEKLRYRFENFISKGGSSIFLSLFILFLISFVLILIIRAVIFSFEKGPDIVTDMWNVFLQISDPGAMDKASGQNLLIKISTIIGGLLGVVIFSMLIAFITTQLEKALWSFRKGHSKVIEDNQTIILGWNNRVFDIIKELIIANESEKKAKIVILADIEKEEMDEAIHNWFKDTKTTKIITRKGAPSSLSNIRKVNAKNAKSAIVLADCSEAATENEKMQSDAKVFKTILALNSCKKKNLNIVADLFFDNTRDILRAFNNSDIVSIDSWEILGKVLVQTSRTRGLSVVYNELLSFDGSEIYYYEVNEDKEPFGMLIYHFEDGIPIGIYKKDQSIQLRPNPDTILSKGDFIIIIADDDSSIQYNPKRIHKPKPQELAFNKLEKKLERQLIIGWHTVTITLIKEYSDYLLEGSIIDVVVHEPGEKVETAIKDLKDMIGNHLQINLINKNPMKLDVLKELKPFAYDNVIILSQDEEEHSIEKADSETLAILFMLRNLAEVEYNGEIETQLITQVLSSENEELVSQTHVDDFLISNKMLTMIYAQLSENPRLKLLYDDLFSEEGSEIYIKPANLYFSSFPQKIRFVDLIHLVGKRDEICLGYRESDFAYEPDKHFGIIINPKKDDIIEINEQDAIIVLSEDEL